MSSTGLLVVSNIKQLGQTLQHLGKYVRTLFIHINIPVAVIKENPAPTWGKFISQLYVDSCIAINDANNGTNKMLDMRVLVGPLKGNSITGLRPIDVLFSDSCCPELCEPLRKRLNIFAETIYLNQNVPSVTSVSEEINEYVIDSSGAQAFKMYDTVVLGGTFDRIHLGHKIFLTQAVLRACRRLVVGVTTVNMTRSKTLWELILPVEQRIQEVKEFLNEIDASVQYDIVPIDDPFGPTRSDPDMNLIIVSEETLRGGEKVNEIRMANNLKPLEIFCVSMVESNDKSGPKETKASSSNTRVDLLGTRLRTSHPRPQLPMNVHVIGLTGGIASGKSKMSQRLQKMGAVIMDCDKIAHEIYEPGQKCYKKIVQHFGPDILIEKDNRIDRKKLGAIVFGKKQELQALDAIVWPELMLEVKRRISDISKARKSIQKSIIVIEAAVLLQAGWETECHEVWSMIVPPEIAVKRVMERNSFSEEDARKRMTSQLSNSEIVAKSHIVFSSQWGEDFTQKQAERAWRMLQLELNSTLENPVTSSSL